MGKVPTQIALHGRRKEQDQCAQVVFTTGCARAVSLEDASDQQGCQHMTLIEPQPGIMDIALYQGGASHVAGQENVVKLSSNENPLGPSEAAVKAFQRAAFDLHRYPSSDHAPLRAAIAEVHNLDADHIICGAGSDEILAFLCQAYAGPKTEVLFTEHGFGMYRINALAAGATPVEVAEREQNRLTKLKIRRL